MVKIIKIASYLILTCVSLNVMAQQMPYSQVPLTLPSSNSSANASAAIGDVNVNDAANAPTKIVPMPVVSSKEINLVLKNHRFNQTKIEIDAGKKYILTVENHDKEDEEFDSGDLGLEQYIKGGQKAIFTIGPLQAGTYEFEGEMHASAKGVIIAK